jgi:LmbE family N-acetylglucosaminyl deacetylase
MKRILIIAAHPDDEILGCGGIIVKYKEIKSQIRVLFLGEGSTCRYENNKTDEAVSSIVERNSWATNALDVLGVDDFEFYNLPCGRFEQVPLLKINKIIEKTINEFKPDTVFSHSDVDSNNDHRIVFKSTIIATRPCNKHVVHRVLSYEVLSSSEWGFKNAFRPNYFIELSEHQVQKKWQALQCYRTEMRDAPFPRSWRGVQTQASLRGAQAGTNYAEAFELIREFKR